MLVGLIVSATTASCHPVAYEQTYLRASHNYAFRGQYPRVDALFNAFDFGHAALYERELRHPGTLTHDVDTVLYTLVTTRVLRHPSSVTLDEHAIAPRYATTAPELVEAFEWAHMLHRQLYDVLSDARIADSQRDARVADVMRYYRSRPDLALSSKPKNMALMEGQPFSLSLRRAAPAYNALIWSYHWLQMSLYEALLAAPAGTTRDTLVQRSVDAFWTLALSHGRVPSTMPLSPAIAERFTQRYPDAAAVFDNLHALHDVVGDILASPAVPPARKRAALLVALHQYQDDATLVVSRDDWLMMAREMDSAAMGGRVIP
ncbi:MAG: hypothetical protein V4550_19955 [Gemmatimonadota bacterium]